MAQEKKSKVSILTNGIIKENPVLRLVLGTCSTLAVTTAVSSALGMGAAFTFVLVCANIMISLLRKVIPGKVHLPCYIVIIAGFVTIVQMFMQAYMESLYNALGVFLPLIVVNCIILGRAEMFACKNSVVDSALVTWPRCVFLWLRCAKSWNPSRIRRSISRRISALDTGC